MRSILIGSMSVSISNMKKQAIIPIIAIAVVALASCGSQRAAVKSAASTVTSKSADSGVQREVNHVSRIASTFGSWTTVQMGGTLSLSGAKSLSSSVTVRMERGKSIYISVRPLGLVEVARAVVQGDTVLLIDRMNKRYVCESIKSLIGGLPADVGTVQDILLGRAFVLGQGTLTSATASSVNMRNINGSYLLQPTATYRGYAYGFSFDSDYCITELQLTRASGDTPLCSVNYGDVTLTVAGNIAGWAGVNTTVGGSKFNFKIDYGTFSWNMPVKIDDNIPSNYSRVSAKTLLGAIGKL